MYILHVHQSIGQRIWKNAIFTLIKKGCSSCYFQANIQIQKHSESIVAMCCFLMFSSSLQNEGDHQQAIQEKDAAIALLNDDLKNREYENVALQAQRDVYQASYKDVGTPSLTLRCVIWIMQETLARTTISSLYGNIQHLPTINIMACHIISRGYNGAKGMVN